MKYIIYKTTNLTNQKYYIGYHATNDLNDEYLGSGKLLKKAIKKYGKENFIKDILYVFPNSEEAFLKEKELVTEEVVKSSNNYNLKVGGEGGWDHINERMKNDPEYKNKFYSNHSHIIKKLYKEGKLNGWQSYKGPNGMEGKNHSGESKRKISENSTSKLSDDVIKQRIKDYNQIEKTRGYVSKLAKKWNISHTQVNRFIKNM